MASERDLPTSAAARRWATAAVSVSVLGIVLALTAVWIAVSDRGVRATAERLVTSGVTSTITSIQDDGLPSVTITVDGRPLDVELVGGDGSARPGMSVLIEGDPPVVMTVEDAQYFAQDDLLGAMTAAVLFLAPAVLTLLVWLVAGRPRWWRLVSWKWVPGGDLFGIDRREADRE